MASKYDGYWYQRLNEIGAAIRTASSGSPAMLEVSDIQRLGERQSWYGAAHVRGTEIIKAPMAQMMSLARLVTSERLCLPWPDREFVFRMQQDGMLTVTARTPEDSLRVKERSGRPTAATHVTTAQMETVPSRDGMPEVRPPEPGKDDLSDTLLLIPCSKSKKGTRIPDLPVRRVADMVGERSRTRLEQGRRMAFDRAGTRLETYSPKQPALAWYTGLLYETPRFRELLPRGTGKGTSLPNHFRRLRACPSGGTDSFVRSAPAADDGGLASPDP